MFKHRKMRFNGEWSVLAGNRVYELSEVFTIPQFFFGHFKIYQYSQEKRAEINFFRVNLKLCEYVYFEYNSYYVSPRDSLG